MSEVGTKGQVRKGVGNTEEAEEGKGRKGRGGGVRRRSRRGMPEVKWGVKGREYVGGRVKVGVRGCAKTKMLGENFTLGAE